MKTNEEHIYLSSNLKYLRIRNKKTQEEVAEICGKKNTAVSNWEKGIREPDAVDLSSLSNFFKVSIDDMMKKDLRLSEQNDNCDIDHNGMAIKKADGTVVFLKNASTADKALIELPEEQKKAILTMIGKDMDLIDQELDG